MNTLSFFCAYSQSSAGYPRKEVEVASLLEELAQFTFSAFPRAKQDIRSAQILDMVSHASVVGLMEFKAPSWDSASHGS